MKARGVTQRRIDARAKTEAGAPPSDGIESKVVLNWWIIALFPVALGCLMYFVEASDFEKSRLVNPVATVGEFVRGECRTYRKAGAFVSPHYMRVTYGFKAPDGQSYDAAGAMGERSAQPLRLFTATKDVSYQSWAECEVALPLMRDGKTSRPVWYELASPDAASTSLDAPDSIGFLWLGLATLPLALYAWLLGVLRQRHGQVGLNQASEASTASTRCLEVSPAIREIYAKAGFQKDTRLPLLPVFDRRLCSPIFLGHRQRACRQGAASRSNCAGRTAAMTTRFQEKVKC